jgi:hypothetical protein
MVEFMQQGTTITSEVYWKTLKELPVEHTIMHKMYFICLQNVLYKELTHSMLLS